MSKELWQTPWYVYSHIHCTEWVGFPFVLFCLFVCCCFSIQYYVKWVGLTERFSMYEYNTEVFLCCLITFVLILLLRLSTQKISFEWEAKPICAKSEQCYTFFFCFCLIRLPMIQFGFVWQHDGLGHHSLFLLFVSFSYVVETFKTQGLCSHLKPVYSI